MTEPLDALRGAVAKKDPACSRRWADRLSILAWLVRQEGRNLEQLP